MTCGEKLHPERAKKYDYCTKSECRRRNARGLRMAAVGVNKAADQFVVLDEKTQNEAASGRYKKVPDSVAAAESGRGSGPGSGASPREAVRRTPAPEVVPSSSARSRARPWSAAQESLAVTYRDMGLTPDAIARKLGVSARLVTQMLLGHDPSRRPA